MIKEILHGQILGKSNNYEIANDGHGGRRIIKNARMRANEELFLRQIKLYRDMMIDCAFTLHAVFYQSSQAFDVDNSVKSLLDILQSARAITNDSHCVRLDVYKRIDPHNPRIIYAIEEHEPTLFNL